MIGPQLSDRLMQQPALAALEEDVRDELAESLRAGQICLSTPGATVSCNKGSARSPDVGTCCRFTEPPLAIVTGIPEKLSVRRNEQTEHALAVHLELRSMLADLTLDQRCQIPSCADDRAMARPQIAAKGRTVTEDGTTHFRLNLDLDTLLELRCGAPAAGDTAS